MQVSQCFRSFECFKFIFSFYALYFSDKAIDFFFNLKQNYWIRYGGRQDENR